MPKPENIEPYKFPKGKSGNPKGRPKGARSRATVAREWLEVEQKARNPITGTDEQLQQQDLMTLALIKKAREGDVGAYRELMDSAYGKAMQKIDHTSDNKPIFPKFVYNEPTDSAKPD